MGYIVSGWFIIPVTEHDDSNCVSYVVRRIQLRRILLEVWSYSRGNGSNPLCVGSLLVVWFNPTIEHLLKTRKLLPSRYLEL